MKENRGFGIAILGKYSLTKEGISRVLQDRGFRILSAISTIEQLKSKPIPQKLLVLIVHAGDDFTQVIGEIEALKAQYPDVQVAVVAEHYGLGEPAAAFKAGAIGYLVNAVSCDAFVKSVELLMLGEAIFPPAFPLSPPPAKLRRPKDDSTFSQEDERVACASSDGTAAPLLSPRETAILLCLIDGNSNKSIARKIGITEATVKAHVKAILRKIRVQNRTQAAIWGMNNALLLQPANSNTLLEAAKPENA
jgi:two-component system nitrate/nitrite response regulator NarL